MDSIGAVVDQDALNNELGQEMQDAAELDVT